MEKYVEKLLTFINYKDGVFVEAGANDGITQSYTYELEKGYNWSGVLIEPSFKALEICKQNRNSTNIFMNCALVGSDYIDTIAGDFDGSLMASVGGHRLQSRKLSTVKAKTLNSILEEHQIGSIDLLSLDVEGFDFEVLRGFDLIKYKPAYVILEVCKETMDWIFPYMMRSGYSLLTNLTNWGYDKQINWDGFGNDFLFKHNIICKK